MPHTSTQTRKGLKNTMGWADWFRERELVMLDILNRRYRAPWLDRMMKWLTHLGGASFSSILLLILTFRFNFPRDGLISLVVSHLFIQILKRSFRRRRPYVVESSIHFIAKPLKDASFPSGHTTAVFATFVSIALVVHWLAVPILLLACIVGWSRIYLGVHYPADVVVGAFIGGITAIIVHLIA
jgi:undecaprenyl-diphosphatase